MRDEDTETFINPHEPTPVPRQQVPAGLCPDPGRTCRWDQERSDIHTALRTLSRQMEQVLQRLAVGSERMKGITDLDEDLAALRSEVSALRSLVADLRGIAGPSAAALAEVRAEVSDIKKTVAAFPLVKAIVFGGVAMILTAVMGALIALVVTK